MRIEMGAGKGDQFRQLVPNLQAGTAAGADPVASFGFYEPHLPSYFTCRFGKRKTLEKGLENVRAVQSRHQPPPPPHTTNTLSFTPLAP